MEVMALVLSEAAWVMVEWVRSKEVAPLVTALTAQNRGG